MTYEHIYLSGHTLKQGWRLLSLRVGPLRKKAQLAYVHGLKPEDTQGPLRDFMGKEQKRNLTSEVRLSGRELWVFRRDSDTQLNAVSLCVLSKRMREHLQASPEQQALLAQASQRSPDCTWTRMPDEQVLLRTQRTTHPLVGVDYEC